MGAAQVVHRMTGMSGFFQGLSARVLYQAPSTAVSWSVYEFFKSYLKARSGATASGDDFETIKDLKMSHSLQTVAARTAAGVEYQKTVS
jgi:hypothetical protein